MKLSEYKYTRPDMTAMESEADTLISSFKNTQSAEKQAEILSSINKLRNHYSTMSTLSSIRYSQDTTSEHNQKEKAYFDEVDPIYQSIVSKFFKEILSTPNRKVLEEKFGKQLFTIATQTVRTFDPSITEDLQKENALTTEYSRLLASARIMYKGAERNLSELEPFTTGTDRETRRSAQEAKYGFFEQNSEELDRLFDELVKTRNTMATKLGHENFIPLGYDRMLRSDYNALDVRNYRNQILRDVVPIVVKEREKQRKRLGLDKMYFYDESLFFPTGNSNPKGEPEWIIEQAAEMYKQLSPETDEFFSYLKDNELMDLVSRKGKAPGGYCTIINDYKSPFIFSNFNGTTHDVIVLTHEAGHAFQCYSSLGFEVPDYYFPTYEACEIHSMSMEFLTWPWMKLFFKEDEGKFRHSHISKALYFWPYGAAVDEFQHEVYGQPSMSPRERKSSWRSIEKKYMPSKDYAGFSFPENGGFWQQQRHIYESPFYYIDYTLAQTCAMQFWQRSVTDPKAAWNDYLRLCKAGGSKSFLELVELAGLTSPFKEGTIGNVVKSMEKWLDQFPETELK